MKCQTCFIVVIIVAFWLPEFSSAQNSDPGDNQSTSSTEVPTADQLTELLSLLDSNKFQIREEATQALIQFGDAAIEPLATRFSNSSPESVRRIKICLENIATQGTETTFFKATALLSLLYGGGNEQTQSQIERLQKEWNAQRTRQTIEELTALGVKFVEPPQQRKFNQEFFLVESFDFDGPESKPARKKSRLERPELSPDETDAQIRKILDGSLVENRKRVLGQQNQLDSSAAKTAEDQIVEQMEQQLAILRNGRNLVRINGNFQTPPGVVAEIGPNWKGSKTDFRRLELIQNLTEVVMLQQDIDNSVLQSLDRFRSLHQLTFSNCRISGKSLATVGLPSAVKTVRFEKQKIEVSIIDRIGKSNTIQQLAFDRCIFSKSAFRRIFQQTSLASLEFRGTQLDSDAFDRMAKMKSLSLVRLQSCKFSINDYYEFRNSRPDATLELVASAFLGVRSEVVGRANEEAVGCVISDVVSDSAAEQGGIQVGDRIAFIAGHPISKFEDLRVYVSQFESGDPIEIRVERNEKMVDLKVHLGNFDDAPAF